MIVSGAPIHVGQQRAVELIKSGSKYVTVVAPRQTGKSYLGLQVVLYWALNWPGSTIFWCAPTYQQAKKPMDELYNAIHESGIVKSLNRSDFEMQLNNGTKILFRSTERADNLRGYTGDFMIVDEAAYHAEEVWSSVLKPIMLVRGKTILFISTPRGVNWFKHMYDAGQDPDQTDYASCRMHYTDNPFLDAKELEEAKRTLPEHIFKAEYEGTFTDSGQTVFDMRNITTSRQWPRPNGKVYCGIDLGRANDWTVATFMDQDGKIVEIYRNNMQEWSTMVNEMLVLIKKWNATVLVEVNSIGDVIFEQLKKQWQNTHPFVTSNKSKNDIIEALAVDLHDGRVVIPHQDIFEALWFELDIFEYEYSPKSRMIRYNAPNGFHDDTVMSLAISNECRKKKSSIGQYVIQGRR